MACLDHLRFGVDGRAPLHQQLDAWQMPSKGSQVERGSAVLRKAANTQTICKHFAIMRNTVLHTRTRKEATMRNEQHTQDGHTKPTTAPSNSQCTPCFTLSLASTVAPFSTSSWTHGKWPLPAAWWRGVQCHCARTHTHTHTPRSNTDKKKKKKSGAPKQETKQVDMPRSMLGNEWWDTLL